MNEALQVTFRHMTTSPQIRELCEQKLQKLRQQYPDATSCHVILDCPGATHHRKGIEFHAQLELTVGRTHTRIAAEALHEDAYAAVRQVFDNARRQIETRAERQTG
jgi:ribosomal subunit interface protein